MDLVWKNEQQITGKNIINGGVNIYARLPLQEIKKFQVIVQM